MAHPFLPQLTLVTLVLCSTHTSSFLIRSQQSPVHVFFTTSAIFSASDQFLTSVQLTLLVFRSWLDYCNSFYYCLQNPVNSPSAHPELSLLSVLSLRLPSPPTLNKSYRYTGLMFRNALNTKSFLLHTTCFSSPIRYLSATSPFSQLDPHNRLPWSPSFIFHLSHVSKSQTVLFDLQHLSYGIKFPTLSVLHSIPQCSSWFACSNPSPVVNLSWRHHSQLKTYLFAK